MTEYSGATALGAGLLDLRFSTAHGYTGEHAYRPNPVPCGYSTRIWSGPRVRAPFEPGPYNCALHPTERHPMPPSSSPKALLFDVFGTVVDWRGSIIRECRALAAAKKLDLDCVAFADAWRAGYRPAMDRVRRRRSALDEHRRPAPLDPGRDPEPVRHRTRSGKPRRTELNRVWHRLKPWPDAVRGLRQLKKNRIIATLSNGNVALLTNMAKNAGLPWDCIFSAELFHHYKPDPETYLGRGRHCSACRPPRR